MLLTSNKLTLRDFSRVVIMATFLITSMLLANSVQAQEQVIHDAQTEFSGIHDQTVLEGTEAAPEIMLESNKQDTWSFEDYDFASGWLPLKKDLATAEISSGQIHLRAQRYALNESYALFYRDIAVPNKFVVEYNIYFQSIEPSGVAVPGDALGAQPTGACARLDVFNATSGLRVDIFTDMMVSFWTRNSGIKDYPTLAYFDFESVNDQWYTLRFECDFTTNNVEVFMDGVNIGSLLADNRNSSTPRIRPMAYSREIGSVAEVYIDSVKLGTTEEDYYSSGTYTSQELELNATALGALSWTQDEATWPYPWGEWTKYSGNPVLGVDADTGKGVLPENMLTDIKDPLQQPIMYEHPTLGYKYWLVYGTCCGYDIRLAYSDNLMDWTPYEGNPILSPGTGESYLFSPNLFKDGDTYYLFYDVALPAQRVAYATATSPLGPWTKVQVILELGVAGDWDEGRVTEPFVFKDGDTYYLFYMGDTHPYGDKEEIGLATTSSSSFPLGEEAGGLWTKHGLILPHNSDPAAWDRGLTADPSVIKVGGTFFMLYTGSYANVNWKLGVAWADSPYGPWNRPSSPNLFPGPDSWDNNRLVRGAIHYHGGNYYMPYSGRGTTYRGGMATAPAIDLEGLITFETRTSPDGSAWTSWEAVDNGSPINSPADFYLQYRATLNRPPAPFSPVLTSVTINYETTLYVGIDIKPGSYPNSINLGSNGVIPVAILTSASFDATTVDPSTVELGGSGVAVRGKGKSLAHEEDVNGDGLIDLLVQVETENLDPEAFQDGYIILTGNTYEGTPIQGSDEIVIVPNGD